MQRADLEWLLKKYETLRALQGQDEPETSRHMRSLAREYPGALRELDDLPPETICARAHELERVLSEQGAAPPWAPLQMRFHRLLRGALAIRRAGQSATSDLHEQVSRGDLGHDARDWADDLPALFAPNRSSLTELTFFRIAAEAGMSRNEVEQLLFGSLRRFRRVCRG